MLFIEVKVCGGGETPFPPLCNFLLSVRKGRHVFCRNLQKIRKTLEKYMFTCLRQVFKQFYKRKFLISKIYNFHRYLFDHHHINSLTTPGTCVSYQ